MGDLGGRGLQNVKDVFIGAVYTWAKFHHTTEES